MKIRPAAGGTQFGVALACWLSWLRDIALLAGIITVLVIVCVPPPAQPQPPRKAPTGIQFFGIPVQPPGTSGAVALYASKHVEEIGNLPSRDPKNPDKGYLDYVPNQTMTQGRRETVSIAISVTEKDLERVREQVFASVLKQSGAGGVNTVKTELINVTSTMSARLTGSANLQIRELSTQEQLIIPGDPTVWHWEVLPTEQGDAELYLVISTHSKSVDGFPAAKDLAPIRRTIHVTINPLYWAQRFFANNLAVIVGILSVITGLAKIPWKKARGVWIWIVGFLKKRGHSIRRVWLRLTTKHGRRLQMPLPIRISIVLMLFLAAGAIGGGWGILSDPSGAFLHMSARDLAGSPFSNFFIPGLFLLVVLGFGSAVAAFLLWKLPGRVSWLFGVGISISLLVWLAVQVAIVGYRGLLQPLYAMLGLTMLALLTARTARAHGRAVAPGPPVSE